MVGLAGWMVELRELCAQLLLQLRRQRGCDDRSIGGERDISFRRLAYLPGNVLVDRVADGEESERRSLLRAAEDQGLRCDLVQPAVEREIERAFAIAQVWLGEVLHRGAVRRLAIGVYGDQLAVRAEEREEIALAGHPESAAGIFDGVGIVRGHQRFEGRQGRNQLSFAAQHIAALVLQVAVRRDRVAEVRRKVDVCLLLHDNAEYQQADHRPSERNNQQRDE